jgi:hypothetical protein
MLAIIIDQREGQEMKYLIKREMDEILFDMKDDRIDHLVKKAMEERYKILFSLFKRVAPPVECFRYIPAKQKKVKY